MKICENARLSMNNKVHKKNTESRIHEMQELLLKLKELVPNMPKNKKLSKLEIIQYVIDYIYDLQTALDNLPASATGLRNCNNQLHHHYATSENVTPNQHQL